MSTYRLYQEARDTAWRALLQLPDKRLPVDAEALAKLTGVEVHPYPDPTEEEKLFALAEKCGPGKAVSLRVRGKWHVFTRPGLDEARRQFALAHELGHLLLGHPTEPLSPGVCRFASLENEGDLMDSPQDLSDYAADIFAMRLLAPACLLHELRVDTPGGIAALCRMPPKAAAYRAERMQTLNQRDVFYVHALERKVRGQFRPFLNEQRFRAPVRAAPLIFPVKKITGSAALPDNAPKETKAPPRSREGRRFLPAWAKYALIVILALAVILVCRRVWG